MLAGRYRLSYCVEQLDGRRDSRTLLDDNRHLAPEIKAHGAECQAAGDDGLVVDQPDAVARAVSLRR